MVALFMDIPEHYGGAERRLARIFNEIARRRSDVEFVAISTPEYMERFFQVSLNGNNFHKTTILKRPHTLGLFTGKLWVMRICRHLIKRRYRTVVYFDSSRFSVVFNILAFLFRIKTLIVIANYLPAHGMHIGKEKSYFEYSIKTAAHVDCLYPSAEKRLKEIFPKKKITITPNSFTDLKRFAPGKKERVMVFAAARLSKSKNPHLLVETLNVIQDKIREHGYKVFICGGGYDLEALVNRVKDNGTHDIISFPGNVNMDSYLPQAEVFFSLQTNDNYPSQALLEAISCGCYIIATDVGETKRLADGISFSSLIDNDKQSLASAILNYLELSEDEKSVSVRLAREFAEKNFLLETSVNYFADIIQTMTNTPK